MEKTSKYNDEISLWMTDGKSTKTFYGFNRGKSNDEQKTIDRLIKRMLLPNRFNYPIARIYVRTEVRRCFVQGEEVPNIDCQREWYGQGLSAFKIKLILNDGTYAGPYYSNAAITETKDQHEKLIEQYCRYQYRNKFASAIILDCRGESEKLVTKIILRHGEMNINSLATF